MRRLVSCSSGALVVMVTVAYLVAVLGSPAPVVAQSCVPDAALPVINFPFVGLTVDHLVAHEPVLFTRDFLGWRKVTTRKLVEGWVISDFCRRVK